MQACIKLNGRMKLMDPMQKLGRKHILIDDNDEDYANHVWNILTIYIRLDRIFIPILLPKCKQVLLATGKRVCEKQREK